MQAQDETSLHLILMPVILFEYVLFIKKLEVIKHIYQLNQHI